MSGVKKYLVILTRDTTESAVVEVWAESDEDARVAALGKDPLDLDFADDENIPQNPYITDCSEDEE
jgi:hypothetical protein